MSWFRQCWALMRKNRIIKFRMCGSTTAEILLPVVVMCIMVGLRAAVFKDENALDLHVRQGPPLTPAQIAAATAAGVPLFQNQTLDNDGGVPFDGDTIANIIAVGNARQNEGLAGVQTIQFVGDKTPTSKVEQIMLAFKARYPVLAPFTQHLFGSNDELEDYITGDDYAIDGAHPAIFQAVSFLSTGQGGDWRYEIRGNTTGIIQSSTTLNTAQSTTNRLQTTFEDEPFQVLFLRGHLLLQDFVEKWVMEDTLGPGVPLSRSYMYQPFPTPPYIQDDFASTIATMLGMFFTIIYMWPVTRLVKGIVEEKQLRIKEGMRMMGLPESALFCSWLTTYAIMFLLTSLGITLVTAFTVYENSDKFYIFLFFYLFALSTFSFCWLLSVFFSRSQVATTFAALLFLALFFPYFAVEGSNTPTNSKFAACICSQICFGLGAVVMAKLESQSGGVNSGTVNLEVDNWTYNSTIGMFIFDFFFYLFLAFYCSQVVPSEWGTQQKLWFCFLPSYWCPKKIVVPQKGDKQKAVMHPAAAAAAGGDASVVPGAASPVSVSPSSSADAYAATFMEAVSEALVDDLGVSIRHLRKTFHTEGQPEFTAVKDMNLDLYSGQIFALLGHNGCGKSVTINMMSGMYAPTSGDAFVYGASINTEMSQVRKLLGVCPQHNTLFDLLTVREHLELYAAIKGVAPKDTDKAIDDMIAEVGLTEKTNDRTSLLSGGMQRKLSVGIALLGDSKIVFLDEPTSGMDPYSRRATWELLKQKKEGRVIIFTTHFMDEADQLGDRIAIMAKGAIKCCGSSLFLKGKYGVGYTLTITKDAGFNQAAVQKLINDSIPDVTLLSDIAAEISYRLPFQSSAAFADVFDAFDNDAEKKLGIAGYGISVTTLEEVFLRVGHEEDARPEVLLQRKKMLAEKQQKLLSEAKTNVTETNAPPQVVVVPSAAEEASTVPASAAAPAEEQKLDVASAAPRAVKIHLEPEAPAGDSLPSSPPAAAETDRLTKTLAPSAVAAEARFAAVHIPGKDTPMYWRHFKALFWKRWLNAKRDRKVWTWTLVYPFLIILLGCGLITLTIVASFPPLALTPSSLNMDTNNFVPYDELAVAPAPQIFAPSIYPLTDFTRMDLAAFPPGDLGNTTAFNRFLLDDMHPTYRNAFSRYNAFQSNMRPAPGGAGAGIVDQFVVYFNTSCQWASALGLNMYNTQLLKHLAPASNIQLNVAMHPFPQTKNQKTLISSLTAVIVAIGFAFMPANFIAFAVKEEQDKVKHQQLISGVSAFSYWGANYVWDFCNYMVMGLLCLLIFRIWSIDALIGDNTGGVFLCIIMYGLSVIPFNYVASFMFTESTSAQNSMLLFYIFAGALVLIATIVLSFIESTKYYAWYIKFVCRLVPSYCFGECIANILVRTSITAFGAQRDIFDWEIIGYPMIFMAAETCVYIAMVLIYEKILATPSWYAFVFGNAAVDAKNSAEEKDPDVIHERERLQAAPEGEEDWISVKGLRKVFKGRGGGKNKVAVQNLWLGIPQGQCFGFLGINGAGKTITLKALTGDIIPTSGTASLGGFDILKQQNDVRRLLGYCPQFDSLIDTLTAREHLVLFARIKGVPEDIIHDYAEHLIAKLGLQEGLADKPTIGYSGGNKRKLCVGIALIGNPPIVFLDEPSTGMDPGSRRFMWDLIASTMKHRSVILTTHSMEECEALCHRIGIMVGGRLRCLGSTTHLKNVYGDGYQLDVNVAAGEAQTGFKTELTSIWSEMKIIEQHGDALKFRLPREFGGKRTTIGQVFRLMEQLKGKYQIRDYSVSETTLEQIFIHFAKQQEEETGAVAGITADSVVMTPAPAVQAAPPSTALSLNAPETPAKQ